MSKFQFVNDFLFQIQFGVRVKELFQRIWTFLGLFVIGEIELVVGSIIAFIMDIYHFLTTIKIHSKRR